MTVIPYAGGSSFEGSVSEINPLVDTNGMVKVKAGVNGEGKLFSGMNVRVSVRRNLGEQLVIPKTAVVLRGVYIERRQGHVELCAYGIGERNGICCFR